MLRLLRSVFYLALFVALLAACAGGEETGCEGSIICWEATNWPQGASVRALAIHPEQPQVLFAGLNGQGVYQSTDDGRTWQPRSRGLANSTEGEVDPNDPALKVRTLLVSRTDPERLLAGSEGGVFQTTDGGQSWQQQIPPETWDVHLRTQFARTHALAGASTAAGEVFYLGTDAGLFRLQPGSEGWQPTTLTGLQPEDAVWAVWIDPDDPETVYAGTAGKGAWASSDGGETWVAMNEGLEGEAAHTINKLVGDGAGRLFAGTWGDGVYVWQDAGWSRLSEGLPDGARVWSLAFDPAAGVLVAGLRDDRTYLWRENGPWQPAGLGAAAWTLASDESSGRLYAGTFDQGVARSTDGGATWVALPLQGSASVRALLFAADSLFAGTENRGLYATTDRGATWARRGQGFSPASDQVWALAASLAAEDTLYAGTFGDGVYQSTDAGFTWAPLAPESLQHPEPDVEAESARQVISLAVQQWEGRERVFAGTQFAGLYAYDPLGDRWRFAGDLARQAGMGATVASLVVGPDGFLYAAINGAGIFRSQDGGERWEVMSREVIWGDELAAAPRTGLQTWFHGADRLYARTFDGLYGSNNGEDWQRLISGDFGAVVADIAHPQIAYMGVMTTTLASAAMTPTFASLLSLNGAGYIAGSAWQEAGPIAAPITVLAADPDRAGVLFAGTTEGVYQGWVDYPLLWREIAAWVVLLAPLLLALGLAAYAYAAIAWPYGVSLAAALNLLLFRRREMAMILAEPTALSPLEQLILIEADRPPWLPETIVAALTARQAHANSAQIAAALNHLAAPLGLLARDAGGRYRLVAASVGKILARRTRAAAPLLAKAVREENNVYLEVREFFRRSGLAVLPRGDTLLLQSPAPPRAEPRDEASVLPGLEPYMGAEGVFMARLVANRRPGAEEVDATLTAAASEYNQQVSDRLAFLVVVDPPDASVYRRIAAVQSELGLSIVLISHAAIHRALGDGSISAALQMALRRARGDLNAGLLAGPIFDPLDFCDRGDWLTQISKQVSAGKTLLLAGPPQVGKSSLAWQSVQSLTDHVVAYARAGDSHTAEAIGRDLLMGLLVDGAQKYPQIEWPFRVEQIDAGSFDALMQQIDAVVEALRSQTQAPRLALVIDDLQDEDRAVWEAWSAALVQRSQVGLLGVLAGRGVSGERAASVLLPFTLTETETAASILAAQAGAALAAEGATEALHQQSGGHPLLLRQLFGLALARARADKVPGARLTSAHIMAAVEQHIRISPIYGQWWQGWSEAEREILLALAAGETPDGSLAPALPALAAWRWIEPVEGGHRIAAQALAAWLRWAILLTSDP